MENVSLADAKILLELGKITVEDFELLTDIRAKKIQEEVNQYKDSQPRDYSKTSIQMV